MVNGMWPLSHFWKDHGDDHGGGDGDGDGDGDDDDDDDADDDADDADDAAADDDDDDDDDEGEEEEEEASRWHSAGSHQVKMTFRCCHAMQCHARPHLFLAQPLASSATKPTKKIAVLTGRCAWSNF